MARKRQEAVSVEEKSGKEIEDLEKLLEQPGVPGSRPEGQKPGQAAPNATPSPQQRPGGQPPAPPELPPDLPK